MESPPLALGLSLEEGVVLDLDKNVALVLVLVLVLEEGMALALEEDVDRIVGLVLALEEEVARTEGHPSRGQGPRGGKQLLKDTYRGECQRGS